LSATAVEEIRHTDYVRTATAKGLGARQIFPRHVLPNAAPNIISATVLATRGALSSVVLIVYVFTWGGAGLTFVQALGNGRMELAVALALSFAVGSALLALAADLAPSLESRVLARSAYPSHPQPIRNSPVCASTIAATMVTGAS
jgi:ABC-type dipeptide/oligopeptide/nickel transport system permease component